MNKSLALIVAAGVILFSQESWGSAPDSTFERFRARLSDGTRVEGTDGLLTAIQLVGNSSDGTPLAIQRTDILTMDRLAGSKADRGAALGGGVGLLTAGAVLLVPYLIHGDTRRSNTTEVLGACTIGGILIGFMVGAATPNWERIVPKPHPTAQPSSPSVPAGMARSQRPPNLLCISVEL